MPGLRLTIPRPSLDTSAPRLYDDLLMSKGSLVLLEPGKTLNAGQVPVVGNLFTNLAASTAELVTGVSGNKLDYTVYTERGFESTDHIVERTSKGGLHVAVQQDGPSNPNGAIWGLMGDEAFTSHFGKFPKHAYYVSAWTRPTRFSRKVAAGNNQNLIYIAAPNESAGTMYGNVTIAAVANNGESSMNSPLPVSSVPRFMGRTAIAMELGKDHYIDYAFDIRDWVAPVNRVVNRIRWQEGSNTGGGGQSWILYRYYIEDLTVSGRTYNEVSAIDKALYAKAFGIGGRYADDTYTSPTNL